MRGSTQNINRLVQERAVCGTPNNHRFITRLMDAIYLAKRKPIYCAVVDTSKVGLGGSRE